MRIDTEATAAESTTLTAPRQSSQLLQVLRLVLQGSVRELRRYLARGGDPNARVYQAVRDRRNFNVSSEEYTGSGAVEQLSMLAMCCFRGWTEQFILLIDAGADLGSDVGTSLNPMCAAARQGDIATMALLKSRGASIQCDGHTPLMSAAEDDRLEAAKWLVDHGADVSAAALVPSRSGDLAPTSAMLYAAMGGSLDVLRYLHAQGAPFVAEAGGQASTALHRAAHGNSDECVRFILACGFGVDTKVTNDLTALHTAS